MKYLYFVLLFIACNRALAQTEAVGLFDYHGDIGHPKNAGSAQYDKVTHTYYLKGSGYNIWFNRDEFQFAYKKIKGDFTATAVFEFIGEKGNDHRKIGWMIRESTDDKSIELNTVEHGDGLTVMQWRSLTGENMKDPEGEIFYPEKKFEVIQLQRSGKKLIMRIGHVGGPLKTVGAHEMPNMPDEALLGLFICSHDPEIVEEARVWDVHIEQPAEK